MKKMCLSKEKMCFSKYFFKLKLSLANDFNHFSLPELVYALVSSCVRHAFSLPCFDDYMVLSSLFNVITLCSLLCGMLFVDKICLTIGLSE